MLTIEMTDGTIHEWTVDADTREWTIDTKMMHDLSDVKRVSVSGDELLVMFNKQYPDVVARTPDGESVVFVDNAARFILPTCEGFLKTS